MRLAELEKLKKKELRWKADEAFQKADEKGPGYFMEAQFYVQELDRRHDSWISTRDLILEVVIIAMIGWEIYMGYHQERDQATNFTAQQAVLGQMLTSARATADTLTSLATTTNSMNTALQKQLALFYDVSLNVLYEAGTKRINVVNQGRTNVQLWSVQFAGAPPIIDTEGRNIEANGAGWEFDVTQQYDALRAQTIVGRQRTRVPLELYVKNARGEEFTVHCYLNTLWDKDTMTLTTETTGITPENWSRKFPIPKTPETKH